jgi:hypothetical protein
MAKIVAAYGVWRQAKKTGVSKTINVAKRKNSENIIWRRKVT